jgi:hypothetical protein
MKQATLHIILPEGLPAWQRAAWALHRKRRRVRIPQRWAELTPRQALRLARLHLGKTGQDFRVSATMSLLRISSWALARIGAERLVETLLPALDWAAAMKVDELPAYTWRIGWLRYLVPAPGMADMPIQQYLWCEEAFEQVTQAGAAADPSSFLAALLRPARADRHRQAHGVLPVISQPQRDRLARQMRRASPALFWLLLHYYATQREGLAQRFPNLHKKPEPGAATTPPTDWQALPGIIAEARIFGALPSVLATPVLSYLAWANARQAPVQEKPKTLQDLIREQHKKHIEN